MSHVIDRRINGRHRSAVNRQRFIRRFKAQLKKAVAEAAAGRSITDMDSGEQVVIPARDTREPVFHHGPGGAREQVHPGNREFQAGDRVERPRGGGGSGGAGGEASDRGQGEDDFVFELSREEFLDLFFEDLQLPDLVRKELARETEYRPRRAGFSAAGTPANISVVRSLRQALARRKAMGAPHRRRLQTLCEEAENTTDPERAAALVEEIAEARRRLARVPFLDTVDLRYNHRVLQPQPATQAVMFCLMDVSGSMDQARKDLAKRFFTLLYLFLQRQYRQIDVVFIRHHTIAAEVDEEEFFYSRETGGTVVSSALTLMAEVIAARYPPSAWNVYAAQASDGDNWNDDSPICRSVLTERIMPATRYFAYVEITPERHQSLWQEYLKVQAAFPAFAMRQIDGPADIYPVFRDLFRRRAA